MPEGDSIHWLAHRLRDSLVGRPIRAAWSRAAGLDGAVTGRTVVAAGAVGKHLLLRLDDDTALRVHLGIKGGWRTRSLPAGRAPRDTIGLELQTDQHRHTLTFPKHLEHLEVRALATHPILSALGPDLAVPGADLDVVIARARAHPHLDVADLLMCQQVACGVGNVFKCEVLFLRALHPAARSADLSDLDLRGLYALANRLVSINVRPGFRNTTGRTERRLWVYGQPVCDHCGSATRKNPHGRPPRVTWWCPSCQAPARSSSSVQRV